MQIFRALFIFNYDIPELTKFVSPVRDQQNLGRFCLGLTQDWYFAIEN